MSRYPTKYPTKAAALPLPQVLGLGSDGMAWCSTGPAGGLRWHRIEWPADGAATAFAPAAVDLWEQSVARRGWAPAARTTVCLSSALVRHWLQTAPRGTRSLAELHAVASARAQVLLGRLPGESWLVSGAWEVQRPFVCTALASRWAPLLHAIARTHRHARTVDTWSLVASQRQGVLPHDGWLALVTADRLHLMHRAKGCATSMRSLHMPARGTQANGDAVVLAEWHREKLRTQKSADRLHWLSLPPCGHPVPTSAEVVPLRWDAQAHGGLGGLDGTLPNAHGAHLPGSAVVAALEGLHTLWGKVRHAV